jgi:hypothetical protein
MFRCEYRIDTCIDTGALPGAWADDMACASNRNRIPKGA